MFSPKQIVVLKILNSHGGFMIGEDILHASQSEIGRSEMYVCLRGLIATGFIEESTHVLDRTKRDVLQRRFKITAYGSHVLSRQEHMATLTPEVI